MGITFVIGPLIIYFALYLILKYYMTEKRFFLFKDKCILTVGGFITLMSLGLFLNSIILIVLSFAFLMHILILIYPLYRKIFGGTIWK